MPSVSVVIAAKNRPADLRRLLASLQAQTLAPAEVVVIDDGSEPALPPVPCTRQIRNEISLGACKARNLGFKQVTGTYVFIFDDDAELIDPRVIERAVATAERVRRLGAIAFKQLTPAGESHWMQPAPGEALRMVPSFLGYAALLSRDAFETVGGFFEPLGYYYEENELCLRLIDSGYDVIYDPALQVVHHENQAGRNTRLIHRLAWRNYMFSVVARYPIWLVAPGLARATLRWIKLSSSWGHFRVGDLLWGWQGLGSALPRLLPQRKAVQLETLRKLRLFGRTTVAPQLD
jgi:GT2 family glycosyltransferase